MGLTERDIRNVINLLAAAIAYEPDVDTDAVVRWEGEGGSPQKEGLDKPDNNMVD